MAVSPRSWCPIVLKSAVSRACRYEPELNPTYAEMASHYGICVLPARPARPRDKAKVETGVLIAKRWILSALRHRTFYSLAELNGAIQELLERLNSRALRKLKKSRRELFSLFDQPNALSLPEKSLRVCRVESRHRQHRLPHRGRQALLQRAVSAPARKTRCPADRPYGGSLPERRAGGHPCQKLHPPSALHAQRTHAAGAPELSRVDSLPNPTLGRERSARTPPRWSKRSSRAAPTPSKPTAPAWGSCAWRNTIPKSAWRTPLLRALKFGALSFKALRKILSAGLDRLEEKHTGSAAALPAHDNIRGGHYYH